MEGLAVEVCGENGAYYNAYIVDVEEEGVLAAFGNYNQPQIKVPFQRVRLPPVKKESEEFTENQEVEVFSHSNEQEAGCWWKAIIRMRNCGFHVVEYAEWKIPGTEIVPSYRLRARNRNPPLTKNTFKIFELEVPSDLKDIVAGESHRDFKKALGAAICRYDAESECLKIITKSETTEKRFGSLCELHFRNLRQKVRLLDMTDRVCRRLEKVTTRASSEHVEEFQVEEKLMGLAIGTHGSNIRKARSLQGVTRIDSDYNTFRVYGETKEAVQQARGMLEWAEESVKVPHLFVGRFIGKGGKFIQEIIEKTCVQRIRIEKRPDDKDEVSFIVIGTMENVNHAKDLLEYNLEHLKEVEKLRRVKNEIALQLQRKVKLSSALQQQTVRKRDSASSKNKEKRRKKDVKRYEDVEEGTTVFEKRQVTKNVKEENGDVAQRKRDSKRRASHRRRNILPRFQAQENNRRLEMGESQPLVKVEGPSVGDVKPLKVEEPPAEPTQKSNDAPLKEVWTEILPLNKEDDDTDDEPHSEDTYEEKDTDEDDDERVGHQLSIDVWDERRRVTDDDVLVFDANECLSVDSVDQAIISQKQESKSRRGDL